MNNPLDFDGMLDRVIAGEEMPLSLAIATIGGAMTKERHSDLCTEQGEPSNYNPPYPKRKKFDITLIKKCRESHAATIETDGNIPEIIIWDDVFFKLNIGLGEPYLYLQIYGANLSDVEAKDSAT